MNVVDCQNCHRKPINSVWYPFCSNDCMTLAINDGWTKVKGVWKKR